MAVLQLQQLFCKCVFGLSGLFASVCVCDPGSGLPVS